MTKRRKNAFQASGIIPLAGRVIHGRRVGLEWRPAPHKSLSPRSNVQLWLLFARSGPKEATVGQRRLGQFGAMDKSWAPILHLLRSSLGSRLATRAPLAPQFAQTRPARRLFYKMLPFFISTQSERARGASSCIGLECFGAVGRRAARWRHPRAALLFLGPARPGLL